MSIQNPASSSRYIHAPAVAFRGSRGYVHSTDLYGEIIEGARKGGWSPIDGMIEIAFRRLIVTQPELRFGEDLPKSPDTLAADFRFSIAGRMFSGHIIGSDRPVTERKPYDESRTWGPAQIEGSTIKLTEETGMLPIEVITALAVRYHNSAFAPPSGMRWLLASLKLSRPLQADDALGTSVVLERRVGKAMTRSSIWTLRGRLGSMDFVLGEVVAAR